MTATATALRSMPGTAQLLTCLIFCTGLEPSWTPALDSHQLFCTGEPGQQESLIHPTGLIKAVSPLLDSPRTRPGGTFGGSASGQEICQGSDSD